MNFKPIAFLACMAELVSCYDTYGPAEHESASVQLKISSSTDGFGVSRAVNGDEYAVDGEFINTLCVFLVDESGQIEAKFKPDLSEDEEAKVGNLASWHTTIHTTPGTKHVYAFANWETAESDEWDTLIAKTESDYISESDITFMVGDLNSMIDISNGKYIPMSGKTTVDVTKGSTNISVELVRLVAKITFDLQMVNTYDGDEARPPYETYFEENPCRLYSVYMDFFAEKVSLFQDLMPEDAYDELNFDVWVELDLTDITIYVDGDPKYVGAAYVNESDPTDYFKKYLPSWESGHDIQWNTDYMEWLNDDIYIWYTDWCEIYWWEDPHYYSYHSSWLTTTYIPRNYVFPTTSVIPVSWNLPQSYI